MRIWDVSLSTSPAYPGRTDSLYIRRVFGVWLGLVIRRLQDSSSALPLDLNYRGYTKIYFGENQLSLGSIGILPLTTSRPM